MTIDDGKDSELVAVLDVKGNLVGGSKFDTQNIERFKQRTDSAISQIDKEEKLRRTAVFIANINTLDLKVKELNAHILLLSKLFETCRGDCAVKHITFGSRLKVLEQKSVECDFELRIRKLKEKL